MDIEQYLIVFTAICNKIDLPDSDCNKNKLIAAIYLLDCKATNEQIKTEIFDLL